MGISSAVFSSYRYGYGLSICREAETGSVAFPTLLQYLQSCLQYNFREESAWGFSLEKSKRNSRNAWQAWKSIHFFSWNSRALSHVMGSLFLCWVPHVIDTYQLGSNLMIKYQHFKILALREFHITKMSVLSLKNPLLLLCHWCYFFNDRRFHFNSEVPLVVNSVNPIFCCPGPMLFHSSGDLLRGRGSSGASGRTEPGSG